MISIREGSNPFVPCKYKYSCICRFSPLFRAQKGVKTNMQGINSTKIFYSILPTAIRVSIVFVFIYHNQRGIILAFFPIMPIIDLEKVEGKIRRQRLGIHGEDEDSDSESSDSKSDIASSENPALNNTQNRGGTATKGGGLFGGEGGGRKDTGTKGPKKEKNPNDRKNTKDKSLWKKLWDWLFG